MTTTPANVGDVTEVAKLLHGKEKTVYADAGYQGAEKRAPKRGRPWYIGAKRGAIKAMPEGELKDAVKHTEHMKAAARSNVEHPYYARPLRLHGETANRQLALHNRAAGAPRPEPLTRQVIWRIGFQSLESKSTG